VEEFADAGIKALWQRDDRRHLQWVAYEDHPFGPHDSADRRLWERLPRFVD
jgi:hypothetical protein